MKSSLVLQLLVLAEAVDVERGLVAVADKGAIFPEKEAFVCPSRLSNNRFPPFLVLIPPPLSKRDIFRSSTALRPCVEGGKPYKTLRIIVYYFC